MSVVMQCMLCVTQSHGSSYKDLVCSGLFINLVGLELPEGIDVTFCGVLLVSLELLFHVGCNGNML